MIPAPARILLNFIAKTETGKTGLAAYNTIFGHNEAKLSRPLVEMTFDQVVKGGPARTKAFGSSAAGAYQFMRDTLDKPNTVADLKGELQLTGKELFDGALQDRLGMALLERRGYFSFIAGEISATEFGKRLAQEWASFPVLAACKGAHRRLKRGETYYAGDKLNKVLVTPETVEAVLAQVKEMAPAWPSPPPPPAPEQKPSPKPREKLRRSKRLWLWLTTGAGSLLGVLKESGILELDRYVLLAILAIIVAAAIFSIASMPELRRKLGIAWLLPLALLILPPPARAHDAIPTAAKPNGWTYPFACCSGYDCREVSAKSIEERPDGYVIAGTGEVVGYTDKRIKDSPDGEFHWCSVAGANDGRTICLFVPPRSY